MKLEDFQKLDNAAQPTPGMGLALDHNGLIPNPSVLAPNPTANYILRYNGTTRQAEWVSLSQTNITFDGWQSYTPALTAVTSNPTLGSGSSQTGRYVQIGKTVHGTAQITFGTAGTAAGTGAYLISLPVAFSATGQPANPIVGSGWIVDSSAALVRLVTCEYLVASSRFGLRYDNAGVGQVSDAAPWAWAASDSLTFAFTYEAA